MATEALQLPELPDGYRWRVDVSDRNRVNLICERDSRFDGIRRHVFVESEARDPELDLAEQIVRLAQTAYERVRESVDAARRLDIEVTF